MNIQAGKFGVWTFGVECYKTFDFWTFGVSEMSVRGSFLDDQGFQKWAFGSSFSDVWGLDILFYSDFVVGLMFKRDNVHLDIAIHQTMPGMGSKGKFWSFNAQAIAESQGRKNCEGGNKSGSPTNAEGESDSVETTPGSSQTRRGWGVGNWCLLRQHFHSSAAGPNKP